MSCEPDQWAKDWLDRQRAEGKTGLTVEKRGGMHIVKWATTKWDPETKKRKKISEYRGVLEPDGTIVPPRPKKEPIIIDKLAESGSARLLKLTTEPYFEHLKFAFPSDYPEIIELVFARCLGKGELSKAGRVWDTLENVFGLRPNTSPASLSKTLQRIGQSRGSQDLFFDRLRDGDCQMAIDMSVIFSKANGTKMNKKGYNRFRLSCPQFNLLMGCGLSSGRPQYMKVLPGNNKEGAAGSMLDEFEIPKGTFLVMDRGYSDSKFLAQIKEKELEYIVAVKRNSKTYDITDTKEGMFRWRKSAVAFGHCECDLGWAYRFENLNHRNDELVDNLWAQEQGKKRNLNSEKAGNFIVVSSKELPAQEVYRIYKTRCEIENLFDTAKNELSANKSHMQDDAHVMGFLFIVFLSLITRFGITKLIENADLLSTYSPEDVLDIFGTMKIIESKTEIRQVVPKDVRDLDAKLGLFWYSTPEDLEKLQKKPKKRGRKPKASPPS